MKEVAQAQLLLLGWERAWKDFDRGTAPSGKFPSPLRLQIPAVKGHHKHRSLEASFIDTHLKISMHWVGGVKGITPPTGVTWTRSGAFTRVIEADYSLTVKAAAWGMKMSRHQRGA